MARVWVSGETFTFTIPSFIRRSARFARPASPFFRRNSTALARSPADSFRAFLQSITPAPVWLLNDITCSPVMDDILIISKSYRYSSVLTGSVEASGARSSAGASIMAC